MQFSMLQYTAVRVRAVQFTAIHYTAVLFVKGKSMEVMGFQVQFISVQLTVTLTLQCNLLYCSLQQARPRAAEVVECQEQFSSLVLQYIIQKVRAEQSREGSGVSGAA